MFQFLLLTAVLVVSATACESRARKIEDQNAAPKPTGNSGNQNKSTFPWNDSDTGSGGGTSDSGNGGTGSSTTPDPGAGGAGTSGAGTSGAGTSGAGTSGAGTSGAGTSGAGGSSGSSGGGSSTSGATTPTAGASVDYNSKIKTYLDAKCVSCHKPNGSRAGSPMENYANAKRFAAASVLRIESNTMPPSGGNTPDDMKTFRAWVDAGTPETAAVGGATPPNGGAGSTSIPATTLTDEQLVGDWNGEQDLVPGAWKLFSIATGKNAPPSNPAPSGSASPTVGTAPAANAITYAQVAPIIQKNCVEGCHAPNGSQRNSALNSFQALSGRLDASLGRIASNNMPTASSGRRLTDAEKKLLQDWKAQGAIEKAPPAAAGSGTSSPPNSTTGGGAATDSAANTTVTEFRIKSGTAGGDWNTAAQVVTLKVGTKFTIHNDDSVVHQWHTNGAPCGHGAAIQPGKSVVCDVVNTYDNNPVLYDHGTNGKFHVRAVR
jgi:hypothetical protein